MCNFMLFMIHKSIFAPTWNIKLKSTNYFSLNLHSWWVTCTIGKGFMCWRWMHGHPDCKKSCSSDLEKGIWGTRPNPRWSWEDHPVKQQSSVCGNVPDLQSGGCRFESRPGLLRTKVYSAFHPSGVSKWVPAIAGKAKAGMVHSDCGWTCDGCAGKTVKSLENMCHTWALLRWCFTTKRRYIKCIDFYLYLHICVCACVIVNVSHQVENVGKRREQVAEETLQLEQRASEAGSTALDLAAEISQLRDEVELLQNEKFQLMETVANVADIIAAKDVEFREVLDRIEAASARFAFF